MAMGANNGFLQSIGNHLNLAQLGRVKLRPIPLCQGLTRGWQVMVLNRNVYGSKRMTKLPKAKEEVDDDYVEYECQNGVGQHECHMQYKNNHRRQYEGNQASHARAYCRCALLTLSAKLLGNPIEPARAHPPNPMVGSHWPILFGNEGEKDG